VVKDLIIAKAGGGPQKPDGVLSSDSNPEGGMKTLIRGNGDIIRK
jgi:hypothetical protein